MKIKMKVSHVDGKIPEKPIFYIWPEEGGTIGRHNNNDWVLPDEGRQLSGQHAVIEFNNDTFWIRDTSLNGVFLHHNIAPLGNGNISRLLPGDKLCIGNYKILVSVEQAAFSTPSVNMNNQENKLINDFVYSTGINTDFSQKIAMGPLGKLFRLLVEVVVTSVYSPINDINISCPAILGVIPKYNSIWLNFDHPAYTDKQSDRVSNTLLYLFSLISDDGEDTEQIIQEEFDELDAYLRTRGIGVDAAWRKVLKHLKPDLSQEKEDMLLCSFLRELAAIKSGIKLS